MSSTSSNLEHTASQYQDVPMRFFSVEWLEDGQISVERDDGIIFRGTLAEILPTLNSIPLVLAGTI